MYNRGPTEGDRLVTRLLAAFHAEKELKALSIEGLSDVFSELDGYDEQFSLPSSEHELSGSLQRLESAGYVSIDNSNPHVSVALPGFISCGLLDIPSGLAADLRKVLDTKDLR